MSPTKRASSLQDKRSKAIVVVTHCILNQNSKVEGIAKFPGTITPVVDFLVREGLGILQMPCPETTHAGIRRWQAVKEQYDTPAFREHCRKLARSIANQIQDYCSSGYRVVAILGADGSPSCGVNRTPRSPTWGGLIPDRLPNQEQVSESGVYVEILKRELEKRGLRIPFIGVPESPEIGDLAEAVAQLRRALGR